MKSALKIYRVKFCSLWPRGPWTWRGQLIMKGPLVINVPRSAFNRWQVRRVVIFFKTKSSYFYLFLFYFYYFYFILFFIIIFFISKISGSLKSRAQLARAGIQDCFRGAHTFIWCEINIVKQASYYLLFRTFSVS